MRLGIDFESVGCMLLILLRARRRVCRRGDRGKLERAVMSLSVKSIASWSYIFNAFSAQSYMFNRAYEANLCDAQVLNSRDFMSCSSRN